MAELDVSGSGLGADEAVGLVLAEAAEAGEEDEEEEDEGGEENSTSQSRTRSARSGTRCARSACQIQIHIARQRKGAAGVDPCKHGSSMRYGKGASIDTHAQ